MAVKIGYPGYILNNTALDEEYTNVSYNLCNMHWFVVTEENKAHMIENNIAILQNNT